MSRGVPWEYGSDHLDPCCPSDRDPADAWAAAKLQIIAVSVDPRGDTPRTVAAFLRAHRMTGRMEYLIGSRPQLEKVWRDWSILSKATPTKRDPDLVEHSALVYGISASGRITTLYQHDFTPQQIAHDVPILASE